MAKVSNVLSFVTPARWWGEKWREGLYLGNGKTGANVYGGATDELVLINDAALYWQGRTTVVPDISEQMDALRTKIAEGEFLDAQKILPRALQEKNFHPRAEYPLPLCVLQLHFVHGQVTTAFSRKLDMEHGVATVSYSVGNTAYSRDIFVSRENNTIVYRLSKQGNGTVSCDITCALMHELNARTHDGVCAMPEGATCEYDKQFVCFAARNDDTGADYGIVAKVAPLGGTVRAADGKLSVRNAQQVLITVQTFTKGARQKEWANLKAALTANRDGYEKQLKAHSALHAKLFNSCSIKLDDGADSNVEDLLLSAEAGTLTPMLTEKLYKLARYLLISGSTEQKGFAPTGLWNGSYMPYRAFRCYNGEFQMSHLFALQGGLSQDIDKMFDYFEYNLGDYKINAQRIFGCRGAVIPVVEAPRTGRLGVTDVFGVHFSGCAAWVCDFFYKYARYTQNTRFLKARLIPFMKEVALFYTDFIRIDEDGSAEIAPSALPMRLFDASKITDRPVIAKNSALDFALAKQLLTTLVAACEELNVKFNPKWKELADKIPEQQVGSDGAFREFVNSVISVDYTAVSNGTLYQAFFGDDVSRFAYEDTVYRYLATADKKLSAPSQQNSFNMCVLSAVYARLGEGDRALQCLTNVVRGCAINNLVLLDKDWRGMGVCGSGVWTPVQLHSNLVLANTVQQMLMYSHGNLIDIFPALPSSWNHVAFTDMVAECGVTVSAAVDAKGQLKIKLAAKKETHVSLALPSFAKKLVKASCELSAGDTTELTVPAGKAVELIYKTNLK